MTPEEFKTIRKRYKLTQKKFAEKLGKGLRTIQDYEKGKYPVPLHVIKIIYLMELVNALEQCKEQNDSTVDGNYPHIDWKS